MTSTSITLDTLTQYDVRNIDQYFIRQGVKFYEKNGKRGLIVFFTFIMDDQKFITNEEDKRKIITEILLQCNQ